MQGTAKILYINGNSDVIISSAGRISTTMGNADNIYNESLQTQKKINYKLIEKILFSGHQSILEHSYVNISFNNVSVWVEQFMIEFRLASFTVKSRRYVDFSEMGFYTPDFSYTRQPNEVLQKYNDHMKYLFSEYNCLLEIGVPKEDARFVLPYSFKSNFYCTVNLRELIYIVNEMVNGRGVKYPEIKKLGMMLLNQVRDLMPFLEIQQNNTLEYNSNIDLNQYICNNCNDDSKKMDNMVDILNITDDPCKHICKAFVFNHQLTRIDIDNKECRGIIVNEILKQSRRRELEQVNITARFNRISLAGITHLVRHRMQSLIVPEFIYSCDFSKYITPKSIVDCGAIKRYRRIFCKSKQFSDELKDMGVKLQDTVYFFLSGMVIPVMTTMNANELLTFIELRTCNRAQWEIRTLANELLFLLREYDPELFKYYGPSCFVRGYCPERAMSCHKIRDVKKKYNM